MDRTLDAIWRFYQRLKAYRESPQEQTRERLETDFDELFLAATGWPELNAALSKIHGKRAELLLVLEHPSLPLHNNHLIAPPSDLADGAFHHAPYQLLRSYIWEKCRVFESFF